MVLAVGSARGQFGGGSSPGRPPGSYSTPPRSAGRPRGERPSRPAGPGRKLTPPQLLAPPPTTARGTAAAPTKTPARQPRANRQQVPLGHPLEPIGLEVNRVAGQGGHRIGERAGVARHGDPLAG